jgi:hypothetical protein
MPEPVALSHMSTEFEEEKKIGQAKKAGPVFLAFPKEILVCLGFFVKSTGIQVFLQNFKSVHILFGRQFQ